MFWVWRKVICLTADNLTGNVDWAFLVNQRISGQVSRCAPVSLRCCQSARLARSCVSACSAACVLRLCVDFSSFTKSTCRSNHQCLSPTLFGKTVELWVFSWVYRSINLQLMLYFEREGRWNPLSDHPRTEEV